MNNKIEALLAERQGYVIRNLPLRVALVDAMLRKLGHDLEARETASIEVETETAVAPKAKRKRVQ